MRGRIIITVMKKRDIYIKACVLCAFVGDTLSKKNVTPFVGYPLGGDAW